jgi:hypothetical protein
MSLSGRVLNPLSTTPRPQYLCLPRTQRLSNYSTGCSHKTSYQYSRPLQSAPVVPHKTKQEPICPRKQTTTTHTMHLSAVHSSRYYSTRSEGMAAGATTCNTLVRRSEGTSEWDMVWIIIFSIVGAARVVGLILRSITSPSVRRAKRNRIYELRHRRVCYGEQ